MHLLELYCPVDDYLDYCYLMRSMLDSDLIVALSSDAPVVPDDNPILDMKEAIDCRDSPGEPIALDQAITQQEAYMLTKWVGQSPALMPLIVAA